MRTRYFAAIGAVAVFLLTAGPASAQPPPAAGQSCPIEGATSRDYSDRMMWCVPTMTGDHDLVWQYSPGNLPS